jgi:hypothetical protein
VIGDGAGSGQAGRRVGERRSVSEILRAVPLAIEGKRMDVYLRPETITAAQLDTCRPPVVHDGVSALCQDLDRAVHSTLIQAEVEVAMVPRLPAKNGVHGPATVDERLYHGCPEEVQYCHGLCSSHLIVKAHRETAVEVSELGGKPWVSAIWSSPIWIDAHDRTHVQRTVQVRPDEAAWSLSVEPQPGAQAARIDGDGKQVVNTGEE